MKASAPTVVYYFTGGRRDPPLQIICKFTVRPGGRTLRLFITVNSVAYLDTKLINGFFRLRGLNLQFDRPV